MNRLLTRIINAFSKSKGNDSLTGIKNIYNVRQFEAGRTSRLNFGWGMTLENVNLVLAAQLQTLKARSRDLLQNSTLTNSYCNLMTKNVVGSEGINLKNKAVDNNGKPDVFANQIIEKQWADFSLNPAVSNNMSLKEIERLLVQSLSLDGEAILVRHKGFDNKYNYAVEVIDSINLDPTLNNVVSKEGNRIICGIEFNKFNAPLNYYFRTPLSLNLQPESYTVIPANRVIHLFSRKLMTAVRGYPPTAPVMTDLKILDGYIESELVASRMAAAKMGFIQTNGEVEYKGDGKDIDGNIISEVEPGMIEVLPMGQTFTAFDPKHPTTAFEAFIKTVQKQVSSALDISYNSLVSDYEAINYSSMRAASLADRETYKVVQDMLIEKVLYPVFEEWLSIQLLNKNINLPIQKLDKFNQPTFLPKKWAWVDPQKDVLAAKIALEIGTTSRTRILAEQGQDFTDILAEREAEEKAMKLAGVVSIFDLNQPATGPINTNQDVNGEDNGTNATNKKGNQQNKQ